MFGGPAWAPHPPPPPRPAAEAATAGPSTAELLTRFRGLVDEGVITPDEFEAVKQRLLSGS